MAASGGYTLDHAADAAQLARLARAAGDAPRARRHLALACHIVTDPGRTRAPEFHLPKHLRHMSPETIRTLRGLGHRVE